MNQRLGQRKPENTLLLIGLGRGADKKKIRNVAYRYGLATQFMRLDHPPRTYQPTYYNNLAAGVFSKGGGVLCAIEDMPGETDLFIGLDLGGVSQRAPGLAFLFTCEGAQLGWQLAEAQRGERVDRGSTLPPDFHPFSESASSTGAGFKAMIEKALWWHVCNSIVQT